LTSTVASRLKEGVGLADVFAALFPCGSITGAPKIRTMQIIAELERDPRGIYTGCMGYWSPGEDACFNVAIRTAHLDTKKGLLEYGVGSGVTWASSATAEYAECLVKAQVMHVRRPVFHLLETMLCEEGQYFLLDRHMQRLADSAAFWGFSCDIDHVEQLLVKESNCLGENDFRVRVLLDDSGAVKFEHHPLTPHKRLKVTLATEKMDSADPFLYHKTTHRAVYEQHLAARADCDDVVLHNERGELTECCIGNLVLEMDGERYTPPIESGLLAGTFRAELLARGEIRERVIKRDELARADAHYLINSVRRWVALDLI
jgi:para-aminobenzoate synthetase/4-amino-4-deoxychorismate lyase